MIDLQPVTLAQLLQVVDGGRRWLGTMCPDMGRFATERAASAARDRQLDAQDRKTGAQLEALSVLIERTGGRGTA